MQLILIWNIVFFLVQKEKFHWMNRIYCRLIPKKRRERLNFLICHLVSDLTHDWTGTEVLKGIGSEREREIEIEIGTVNWCHHPAVKRKRACLLQQMWTSLLTQMNPFTVFVARCLSNFILSVSMSELTPCDWWCRVGIGDLRKLSNYLTCCNIEWQCIRLLLLFTCQCSSVFGYLGLSFTIVDLCNRYHLEIWLLVIMRRYVHTFCQFTCRGWDQVAAFHLHWPLKMSLFVVYCLWCLCASSFPWFQEYMCYQRFTMS